MILESCGVTKGMFFYYFKSKLELGHALAQRARVIENQLLANLSQEAHEQNDDPLEQLIFLLEALKKRYPAKASSVQNGSLLTVFVYESELFSEETHQVMQSMVTDWKSVFISRIKQIERQAKAKQREKLQAKGRPTAESVASHIVALIEGGQVLARIAKKPLLVQEQLAHCQNYLRLLYAH
jgi:TetR/AcrR family transcriptional repressor of nem operon